jgi:hypothetical protein
MLVRAAVMDNGTKVAGVPIINEPASTLCSGLLLVKQLYRTQLQQSYKSLQFSSALFGDKNLRPSEGVLAESMTLATNLIKD